MYTKREYSQNPKLFEKVRRPITRDITDIRGFFCRQQIDVLDDEYRIDLNEFLNKELEEFNNVCLQLENKKL